MPRLSKIGAAALGAFGWTGISTVTASYLVVAGGGGGGGDHAGGGGAGGYRSSVVGESSGGGAVAEAKLTLNTLLSYTVIVGAGGAGQSAGTQRDGVSGSNSVFSTITSIGGGGGAYSQGATGRNGLVGGSGGGGSEATNGTGGAGTANQGFAGGNGAGESGTTEVSGGGGGGAGSAGTTGSALVGGNGGNGVSSSITGSAVTRAGGGGGRGRDTFGTGGSGGGGRGENNSTASTAGTANTGGGGGGGHNTGVATGGKAGGSGIVIISYVGTQKFGGGVVTSVGGNTIHTFNTSGTLVPLSSFTASALIVAGGGAGAYNRGAGGGGGGGMQTPTGIVIDTNSNYVVIVGAGGVGGTGVVTSGSNSSLSAYAIASVGGGAGGSNNQASNNGSSGGSGGGAGAAAGASGTGGTETSGQGTAGGSASGSATNTNAEGGAGGGGAFAPGSSTTTAQTGAGGGAGLASSLSGISVTYAGGGGGSANGAGSVAGSGGTGGGGNGKASSTGSGDAGSGTANTGSGGGGHPGQQTPSITGSSGSGGSGIVIISYPGSVQQMAGGTVTISGGNVIHIFTSSGYLTPIKLVNNSLRFRRAVSGHLTRTNATTGTGGTRIWTLSVWVKRGYSGAASNLLSPYYGGDGANEAQLYFTSSDALQLYDSGGSAGYFNYVTTQVFRDPAAWYHIVAAYDSTQAIGSNRFKVYVNGSQVTSFSTATIPNQNALSGYGGTSLTAIGAYARNVGTNNFDGYMSEYNFIDGQQLTPNSFGTFNSYSVWQPITYGGSYGINGFYLPFNVDKTRYSYAFNTTPSYLTSTTAGLMPLGNTTWSIEFWSWCNVVPTSNVSFIANTTTGGIQIFYRPAVNTVEIGAYGQADVLAASTTVNNILLNAWNHFVFTSNGTQLRIFANGVLIGYLASSYAFAASQGTVYIGTNDGTSAGTLNGFISNLRVCNGSIPTTYQTSSTTINASIFTPPTTVLTTTSQGAANVSLLTCQSATIVDNSSSPKTLSMTGTVAPSNIGFNSNPFYDQGPAGNNWTPNNISLVNGSNLDSMTDVPTLTSTTAANYAVLNPLIKQYNTSTDFTNEGNLKFNVGANGGVTGTITATIAMTSGKWYAEVYISAAVTAQWVGVSSNIVTAGLGPLAGGVRSPGYTYKVNTGNKCNNDNTGTAYAAASTTGDTIGIAMDADTGSITFYKNGASLGVAYTGMTNAGGGWMFGGDSDPGGSFIWNFGQRPFRDTPPATYLPLNTYNL